VNDVQKADLKAAFKAAEKEYAATRLTLMGRCGERIKAFLREGSPDGS
jgi:hypothetical protein